MSGSEKTRDCFCECKITHKKRMFLVGFFVIGVMAAGQALTNEKMPEETKVIVQEVVNPHILRKAQIAQEEINPHCMKFIRKSMRLWKNTIVNLQRRRSL